MKHIKLYENNIQTELAEHFDKLLNWKAINLMIDKLTKYEDMGVRIGFKVCLKCPFRSTGYFDLLLYNTDNGKLEYSYNRYFVLDEIIDFHKEYSEFYYAINLHQSTDNMTSIMNGIYDDIKSKFKAVSDDCLYSIGIGVFKEK